MISSRSKKIYVRVSEFYKRKFHKEHKTEVEKKRFGLIEVMVRTLFFTKTYKNLSKPNIWIYLIGSMNNLGLIEPSVRHG